MCGVLSEEKPSKYMVSHLEWENITTLEYFGREMI